MPVYFSPGIYIQEVPPESVPFGGVSTSTAGFISVLPGITTLIPAYHLPELASESRGGPAVKVQTLLLPPPGEARLYTNFSRFAADYGGLIGDKDAADDSKAPSIDRSGADTELKDTDVQAFLEMRTPLVQAVYGFFNNGGTRCWVARIEDETALASLLDNTFSTIDEIAILAMPGPITEDSKTRIVDHCEQMKDRFAILDPEWADEDIQRANAAAGLIRDLAQVGISAVKTASGKISGTGKTLPLAKSAVDAAIAAYQAATKQAATDPEKQDALTSLQQVLIATGNLADAVFKAADARAAMLSWLKVLPDTNRIKQLATGLKKDLEAAGKIGTPAEQLAAQIKIALNENTIAALTTIKTSLESLDKLAKEAIAVTSPLKASQTDLSGKRAAYRAAASKAMTRLSSFTPSNVAGSGQKNSNFAALYFPRIKVSDPFPKLFDPTSKADTVLVGPCGHIAGVYARVDAERGPYKAPANETLRGALDLEYLLTRNDQNGLNPKGINVIRNINGGITIWGARTLGGDDNGVFRYISTRRYFSYLCKTIERNTLFVVFEPNTPALWQQVKRSVEDFLMGEWRDGGLFGETAKDAFFVKCDAETNPPDSREQGQLTVQVGVAIVKPAEFVIFKVQQTTGG